MKRRADKIKAGIAFMVFAFCGSAMDSDCYIAMGVIAIVSLLCLAKYLRRLNDDFE